MARTIEEIEERADRYFDELTTIETMMHNIMYSKTEEDLEQMGESLSRHLNEEKDLSLMNYRDLTMLICIKRRELEYGKFAARIIDEVYSFNNARDYLSE